ncbi:MAG: ABC transporter permease [Chloroflexi bacterium]|nr:MAG: ABC transporter permease [Chloroflexota bacterium]TMF01624.1 MAG: ABC transporter permease [Chloroflexota bacterium]
MTRSRRIRLQALRFVIFALAAAFFLVPIGAMFEFSTRGIGINSARTFSAWAAIPSTPELATAITVSLELALITSLLMLGLLLPTMVWVRLRLPRLNRIVEFICLMPLTVPAIALVVGIKPLYIWISLNFTDSILALSFAYLILVLPYAYRSLDAGLAAIDLKILTEAARSLGAGWGTVMLRVVVPNMPTAILNASLLSASLVLGEYTFANLLNYENLQVAIQYVSLVSAGTSIAVAVASLLFAFVLLMILSFAGGRLQVRSPGQRA